MKLRADLVQMYRDVHSWVGIIAGLFLFVAFYAGAITMFEEPLKQWASPPVMLPPPVSLEQTPELLQKTFTAHPEAQNDYTIAVTPEDAKRGRLTWEPEQGLGPTRNRHSSGQTFSAGLDQQGNLVVVPKITSETARFVDVLHQTVGLPLPHNIASFVMGTVALLYAVALVSGVIAYLPALVKMLFAVRLGQSLRKRWLDFHNLLGLFSLPFHIIMAVSSVVFAFHGQIFALEHKLFPTTVAANQQAAQGGNGLHRHGGRHQGGQPETQPSAAGAEQLPQALLRPMLAPSAVVATVAQQAPGFVPEVFNYMRLGKGRDVIRVFGHDDRYPTRGPTGGFMVLNGYTGQAQTTDYLPGHQQTKFAILTTFFSLHFGSFGGTPVRWLYVVLGLAGAFLFYTGNQLWVVTRRRKEKERGHVQETRGTWVLSALTTGCTLGCVAGISALFCAVPFLPGGGQQQTVSALYYTVFCAFVVAAFCLPGQRGIRLLLALAGGITALVPVMLCINATPFLHNAQGVGLTVTASLLSLFLLVCAARYKRQL
ncbi:MAG: PepSY-associated TM helix domain-containing protein [Acetobacter orientalis]|uniref:PepSY-associated TM helix domain-containing protein n=1 Tax=Acetobacter orientalis TaxID=146474 RepID=UPI0039E82729